MTYSTSTVYTYWQCNTNVRWCAQQLQYRYIDSVMPMLDDSTSTV